MSRFRRAGPVLAAVALGAGLAACQSGGDSTTRVASVNRAATTTTRAGQAADPEKAALAFARCMREHGINVPDPQPNSGGAIRIGGPDERPVDERRLEAAEKACQPLMQGVLGDPGGPDPAAVDEAIKFARCMRQHGIDLPDPSTDGGGIRLELPQGVRPGSPQLEAAESACRQFQPGRGPNGSAGPKPVKS